MANPEQQTTSNGDSARLLEDLMTDFPCDFSVTEKGQKIKLFLHGENRKPVVLERDGGWKY